jgi:hypothetical protein
VLGDLMCELLWFAANNGYYIEYNINDTWKEWKPEMGYDLETKYRFIGESPITLEYIIK